jgi:hypothetical protein
MAALRRAWGSWSTNRMLRRFDIVVLSGDPIADDCGREACALGSPLSLKHPTIGDGMYSTGGLKLR